MAEQEILLNIETLAHRRLIAINAKKYEIRSISEYGVIDQFRLSTQGQRIHQITGIIADKGINEELVQEFDLLVNTIIGKIVVDLEPKIAEALTLDNKMAIINLFTNAPTAAKTAAADPVQNQK